MFKEKCLSIFIYYFIRCIYLFDTIKRKKRHVIIVLTTIFSTYLVVTNMKLSLKDDVTFLEMLHSLPSNKRRDFVWKKALESLNNQTISAVSRNSSMDSYQVLHQLIENAILRYKVRVIPMSLSQIIFLFNVDSRWL